MAVRSHAIALLDQPALQGVGAEVLAPPPAGPLRRARAAAARSAAARAGPPCRSGSAGWTRSRRSVVSAVDLFGPQHPDPVGDPQRSALSRQSASARSLTSTASTRRARAGAEPGPARSARSRSRGRGSAAIRSAAATRGAAPRCPGRARRRRTRRWRSGTVTVRPNRSTVTVRRRSGPVGVSLK